jgi:hypothetical protein
MYAVRILMLCSFLLQVVQSDAQVSSMLQFSTEQARAASSIIDSHGKVIENFNPEITLLKFYVAQIQFLHKGLVVFTDSNAFHLVDITDGNPFQIVVQHSYLGNYDELQFCIGVDSVTNISGALGGELDPTKGMYWTWQSGYINFKLEGKHYLSSARQHEFQFHLGGYQQPYYGLRKLSFRVKKAESIDIKFSTLKFLQSIDLATTNHIMSPSVAAIAAADIMVQSFNVSQK